MLHKKFKIIFLFCLMMFHFGFSQEGYIPLPATCTTGTCRIGSPISPPLASSTDYAGYDLPASLGTYGTTQVDLYSGIPSVATPLYTIQAHNFALPITMSYDASGIRVSQEASWVGLGWNLSAGAPITRVVRGLDDFLDASGALDDPSRYAGGITPEYWGLDQCTPHCVTNVSPAYVESIINKEDLQSDIFYFNIPGYSGKFILEPTRNQNRQVFLLEKEKIKITLAYTTNVQVPAITIMTPDGTSYVYGEVQGGSYSTLTYIGPRSYTDLSTAQTVYHLDDGTTQPPTTSNIATAWNLQKIITPANEVISFNYYFSSFTSPTIQSEIHVYNSLGDLQNATANKKAVVDNSTVYNNAHVATITFPLGKVVFNKSALQRADLQGQYSLSNISIYNNVNPNDFVKRYQFYYDYFNNGLATNAAANEYLRLKLTKVIEVDGLSGNEIPGYSFTYNEAINCGTYAGVTLSLPSKKSMGIDHWGFFNNKNAGITILKPTKEQVTVNVSGVGYLCNFNGTDGLDRDIDVNYLQSGILTQVSYPTGGYTQFTYEPNDYYSMTNIQKIVGGLRVQKVKASDGVSGKDIYTIYKYWVNDSQYNPTTTSSGVLMQDIMYTRAPVNSSSGWPVYRSSSNVLPLGTHSNGNIVGYSEVTVLSGLNGELGKNINSFYALPNYYYENVSIYQYASNTYYAHVYDMVQKKIPVFNSETDAFKKYGYVKNGLLKKTMSFEKLGSTYVLSSSVLNTYNNNGTIDIVPTGTLLATNVLTTVLPIISYTMCRDGSTDPLNWRQLYNYDCGKVEIISFLTPYNYKIKLTTSDQTSYDQSNASNNIIKKTQYEYANDNHMQLTKECNDNGLADGPICTEYTYPQDYVGMGAPGGAIKEMALNRYIHNVAVEKIVKRKIGGTYYIIGGTVNIFKWADASVTTSPIVLDKAYNLETNSPLIETTNYTQRNNVGYFINSVYDSPGSFTYDDNYSSIPKVSCSNYDGNGNLLESLNQANVPSSTILGYSRNYPIAQAVNAYRDQISYTGFESGNGTDDDNWQKNSVSVICKNDPNNASNVFSGNYSVQVIHGPSTFALLKVIDPSSQKGKYKFSCMVKTTSLVAGSATMKIFTTLASDPTFTVTPNIAQAISIMPLTSTNGSWQYFEVLLDFDLVKQLYGQSNELAIACYVDNSNVTNVIYIDEVRIQPVDAQMTTYSYLPLVGKTSVTDINNRTTFTEYDGFRRIKNIKDQDKNILRRYNYYYKNQ